MYLDVPDARAWVFPNGFQAVGLGLGNAIGAAIAQPDRPTVAAIGDGGAFMALAELETAARLKLDAARRRSTTTPPTAPRSTTSRRWATTSRSCASPTPTSPAIARAAGAKAATVRRVDDLDVVDEWLSTRTARWSST